jgi:hypothetical protein
VKGSKKATKRARARRCIFAVGLVCDLKDGLLSLFQVDGLGIELV